ncbi:adaptin N terminal region-domain-containing protein [Globomyces pollinis-pini]|nr:adaptin N terminal region-domain-containing protein [Globomyces pollinis-pini]
MLIKQNVKFFQNHNSMNGLVNFIAEMRNCRVRDLEQKRVNKELANCRAKFKDPNLNGYNKKKYICKLLYMYILGYDVEFGHVESVNLLSSTKYSEKQIAYLAVSLLLTEESELMKMVVHQIRRDLDDQNEIYNCLALHAAANMGGREISESMVEHIYKKFISSSTGSFVKKKAGLCLLRIYRKYPDLIPAEKWSLDIVKVLDESDLGVVHSAACLILALVQLYPDSYSSCVTKCIMKLNTIVVNGEFDPGYLYYKIPAPWLQVKLLRLLQYYPAPISSEVLVVLDRVLKKLLGNAETSHKNPNQSNAINAVLFEAINYIIHLDDQSSLLIQACKILGDFLKSSVTNQRYLALETMVHIAATGDPLNTLQPYQNTIILSLSDKEDISIRRRGLDLMYSMCHSENARTIVEELLTYLVNADYQFQEELVLKTAILAEKFVSEYTWYVDVILKLITTAGDAASDSLWHRVVQIVTNKEDLREYAAYTIVQALKEPTCHEVTVRIGGHILGEFGHVIVDSPGCSPLEQFMALHSKFGLFSSSTRAILLSTYLKFINLFPEIKGEIIKVFEAYQYVLDIELQQRACEYLAIATMPTTATLELVCEEMPPFPDRESSLLGQLTKKVNDTEDLRVWTIGGKDAQAGLSEKRENTKLSPSSPPVVSPTIHRGASSLPRSPVSPTSKTSLPDHIAPPAETLNHMFDKLCLSANGVLYEDNYMQIGIKSEYQSQLGRMAIFFGNKTNIPLINFQVTEVFGHDIKLTVLERISNVLPASTQLHQMYSIECCIIPEDVPILEVQYQADFRNIKLELKLPIVLSKFMGACAITQSDFFSRWKQIGGPPKESQNVVKPPTALNLPNAVKILSSLNLSFLEGIDPNPDNLIFAGIFSSSTIGKVGCLARIESNQAHQLYRVTVRATNEGVSAGLLAQITSSLGSQ